MILDITHPPLTPFDAIIALNMGPLVTETANGLVEGWMQRFASTDSTQITLLVEAPFVLEVDAHALLIGIADRIAWSEEAQTVFGCSWKTTREAKGAYWNEKIWLEEQRRSPQWRFETIGLMRGVWVTGEGLMRFKLTGTPPFLLRGAVKTTFPTYWPEKTADGVLEMSAAEERATWAALVTRVHAVRSMKARGADGLPWQLPGIHCITYNQKCEFLGACEKGDTAVSAYTGPVNPHDAAIQAAVRAFRPGFGAHEDDIILTPTNYMLSSSCIERWRRRLLWPTESSTAQQIGTAFHAGVAKWYEQDLPMAKGKDLERWLTKL